MRRFVLLTTMLIFMAICSGCATLVSDNKTFSQIDSSPSGAECVVEGKNYKQVIKTSTNLMLPASAAPLTITCNMDRHHTVTELIDTNIDGWIFGNILFGGIIGVIIDVANDSGEKYPENVNITLYQKEFESDDELNAWYDLKEKEINDKIDAQIARAKVSEPKPRANAQSRGDDIKIDTKKFEKSLAEQLAQMKKFRSESHVVSAMPKAAAQE